MRLLTPARRAHVRRQRGYIVSSFRTGSPGTLTAAQDFTNRIAGSGVVWYHDFQSVNEVNAFRWTPAYGSGNDPLALGTLATQCRQSTSDGVTGGSASASKCLEIVRPTGSTEPSYWWRPFSPIQGGTTTGNGRGIGQDDPGAGGTITPQAYTATDGGSQVANWDKGWYGDPSNSGTTPNATWDGNDYYIQAYCKIDPQRIVGSTNLSVGQGKYFYFTICHNSDPLQEIIVESYGVNTGTNLVDNFQMYTNNGTFNAFYTYGHSTSDCQPGSSIGPCSLTASSGDPTHCFLWPLGQWVNIQWHVTAPVSGGNLAVQTWVCLPGTTVYVKIWDQNNIGPFSYNSGTGQRAGYNAVIASIYENNSSMTQFYQRYCQIILSKSFIPCPAVPVTW